MPVSHTGFSENERQLTQLANSLKKVMARYGYVHVEPSIIQPSELFLTKAGDQVVSRLFTFERFGHQLALRPEFTAIAAYQYVTNTPADQVARWQFSGSIFEDDPAQHHAQYQLYSIGAELIGMAGALAEAEIIGMAVEGLKTQGIQDLRLVIGHVGLMRLLLSRFKLDPRTERFLLSHLEDLKDPARGHDYVLDKLNRITLGRDANLPPIEDTGDSAVDAQQLLDALLDATQRSSTMGGRSRHDIVRRLLQKRQRVSERDKIVAALDFLQRWGAIDNSIDDALTTIRGLITPEDTTAHQVVDAWEEALRLLGEFGIDSDTIRIQPDLARSWDYYTGIVFELYTPSGEHVAGGGRYDELVRLLGADKDIPAVGFVYYTDEILKSGIVTLRPSDTPAITIAANNPAYAVRWAQALRVHDCNVAIESELDAAQITIDDTNTAHYQQQSYAMADLNLLIAQLKQA